MKYLIAVIITGLIMITSPGCRRQKNAPVQKGIDTTFVTFSDVQNYGNFDITDKGSAVISSESDWLRLWNQYWKVYDGSGEKTPPPNIDFEGNMVIGVFWGNQCTYSGCTNESPSIESVFITDDTLFVRVGELASLGNCLMCVYPLHLIVTAKHDLPVKFFGKLPWQ